MTATAIQNPKTRPEKVTKSTTDTIQFTVEEAQNWTLPSFQRELRVNEKVRQIAQQIATDGGVLPGILTFAVFKGVKYLLDGQHRRASFLLSNCDIGYADARTVFCESMADMGAEYVRLNSAIAKFKPDDILRGIEGSTASLQQIRKACPWIGYDSIRRGDKSPILSMSVVLRCWAMSKGDIPASSAQTGLRTATEMQQDDVNNFVAFQACAMEAWGRDIEYQRLWGALNLTLCMWLFRRTVLESYSQKSVRMTMAQFKKALQGLSADVGYLDWLVGRLMGDTNRCPCYSRITTIMGNRIGADSGRKVMFPRPAWALGRKGRA